jgi:2-amino-4-hydroxy-6-hydroxymethyldihydropteridine diphosphokinase
MPEHPTRTERFEISLPVVLSLGSNLGDREATIRAAVAEIAATVGVTATAASSLVETAAHKLDGIDTDAPAYLNAVLMVQTTLQPGELLAALEHIEQQFGRLRDERWGDRTLDIDIVAMGGLTVNTDQLTIPHPRAADRAFVLVPWLQIDPDAQLAGLGRVDALLTQLDEPVNRLATEPLL